MSMPTSRFKSRIIRSNSSIRQDQNALVKTSSSVELNISTIRSRPLTKNAKPKSIMQYIPVTLEETLVIPKKKASSKKGINIGTTIRNIAKKAFSPFEASKKIIKPADSGIPTFPPPGIVEMSGVSWKATYVQPQTTTVRTKSVSVANPVPKITVKPIVKPSRVSRIVPKTIVTKTSPPNNNKSKIIVNVNTHGHANSSHHAIDHSLNSNRHNVSRSPLSDDYASPYPPHSTRICPHHYHQPKSTTVVKAKDSKKNSKATTTTQKLNSKTVTVKPKNGSDRKQQLLEVNVKSSTRLA